MSIVNAKKNKSMSRDIDKYGLRLESRQVMLSGKCITRKATPDELSRFIKN